MTRPATTLGPNAWLVDEMHEQYLADPSSVSESWRDFFADYRRDAEPQTAAAREAVAPARAEPAAPAEPPAKETKPAKAAKAAQDGGRGGRAAPGSGARIVANMAASLDVPTATSFRQVPAKLLEVNRRVINGYLGRTRGGKISFTHLIGFAVVRAIHDTVPVMNATFHEDADGKPLVRPQRARRPRHRGRRREERRQPHASSCRWSATRTRSTSAASGAPTRS